MSICLSLHTWKKDVIDEGLRDGFADILENVCVRKEEVLKILHTFR